MNNASNICLVGMMGAGKTTIGRKLAKSIGCEFLDLDHEIEHATGVSIPTIFEFEGEAGFRLRESQTLERMATRSGVVLATGGGVVLNPLNRARLSAFGLTVYLHVPAELLYARTKHDKGRPLLQVENPQASIRRLVEQRDSLYREVADVVVEACSGPGGTVNCIRKSFDDLCKS